jgi:N-acetylglucosaminyl-diphospho-decaprenol L-rhamnosyltransferase
VPKLSVIIVNWNSERYLRECLPTVFTGTTGLDCEIIVVDSASPGGGINELAAAFPSVTFVRSLENIGFGRANNLGFADSVGDLILFLNPDTVVVGDALAEMVRTIESVPTAGIVGCKLLNSDGSIQLSAIQPFPTILNQVLGAEWLQRKAPRCRLWQLDPLFSTDTQPVRVEGVSGACLLVKRQVFAGVGMFSPEYFMYAEDVDLCYKAALAGWDTWFTPSAVVVHHGGGSSRLRPVAGWSAVVQQQAKYIFLEKFRGRAYAKVFRAVSGVAAGVRLILLAGRSAFERRAPGSPGLRTRSAKWTAILKWSFIPGH